MVYSDYTYYQGTYKGTMTEADYNRLSLRASAYIDSITFNRAQSATGAVLDKIKDACCAVADELLIQENGGELAGQTVGAWSQSFKGTGKTADGRLFSVAAMYLSLTGLLYRG